MSTYYFDTVYIILIFYIGDVSLFLYTEFVLLLLKDCGITGNLLLMSGINMFDRYSLLYENFLYLYRLTELFLCLIK